MGSACRGTGPCECRAPDNGNFVNVSLDNAVCCRLYTNGKLQFSISKQSARALCDGLQAALNGDDEA